ncbi:MAG: homoserine O-acetyltransferase [Campylobacterales bacterium]
MKITTATRRFTNPLYLESGRIFEPYEIIYETYGELNERKDNVILVCHALSGSHHAAGRYEPTDPKAGWWDDLIGPSKPVDTNRFFVIATNVIGSCFGSTGPMSLEVYTQKPYRFSFPVLTIKDMVKAQKILLSELGIYQLHAIIGGSMGGMQALTFAIEYPGFAKMVIPMATTHATQPWVIAFNKIGQRAIMSDPAFNNGNYDPAEIRQNGLNGLSVARMTGYLGYLSPQTMQKKFGRNYVANDGLFELFGRYEIERYLDYNGDNFPKWFDPLSYLYITKAINIYDLSRGYDSLDEALSRLRSKLHLISFEGDYLFFPSEMREIKEAADRAGTGDLVSYYEVKSSYGHDAFLVEINLFGDYVAKLLEDQNG